MTDTARVTTLIQRWRRRTDERVEAHQQGLIDAGVMCPECRHTSDAAGPYSDHASTSRGVCGAVTDAASMGAVDSCDCLALFHGA